VSAPRVYTERFGQAMAWAHAVHLGHLRKGTDLPYVSHLISVAALVMEHGGTEDEAIGALLHDAIEDRSGDDPEGMKREIAGRFGEAVLAIVLGCSDAESQTEKDRENGNRALWQSRKDAYVAHLRAAPPRCAWCPCATSCTTPAPSWLTIAASASSSGRASMAAARACSGTTGR